ncbi:phosphatase PAP2 family protein [Roseateles chitosanitabidus]|uniref:phosphatase PAP2 family protein n=1 Tax=Roseateles chitosanitabidus TaxID=65048 RepID=UPI00082974C3|nr:phosphatase PAP2 family protein [Roseateles chitosanitabidus]
MSFAVPSTLSDSTPLLPYWHLFTRLGEAQVLAPLAVVALLGLWACPTQRGVARRWLPAFLTVLALTLGSKVAFMGWGIGSAEWDFTGFSGHAMSAASVLPLIAWLGLQAIGSAPLRLTGLSLAYALAAAIAYSRLPVGAHSPSEALLGFTLGALASGVALARPLKEALAGSRQAWRAFRQGRGAGIDGFESQTGAAPARVLRRSAFLALGMAAILAIAPWASPPTRSHQWVTALSLKLSGRPEPFTRHLLHRRAGGARTLASAR